MKKSEQELNDEIVKLELFLNKFRVRVQVRKRVREKKSHERFEISRNCGQNCIMQRVGEIRRKVLFNIENRSINSSNHDIKYNEFDSQ